MGPMADEFGTSKATINSQDVDMIHSRFTSIIKVVPGHDASPPPEHNDEVSAMVIAGWFPRNWADLAWRSSFFFTYFLKKIHGIEKTTPFPHITLAITSETYRIRDRLGPDGGNQMGTKNTG